jgi:hypothetical protein
VHYFQKSSLPELVVHFSAGTGGSLLCRNWWLSSVIQATGRQEHSANFGPHLEPVEACLLLSAYVWKSWLSTPKFLLRFLVWEV